MNNTTLIIIAFMLLIALTIEGIYAKKKQGIKSNIEAKATMLMMSGKFKELYEYLASDEAKKNLPRFNIAYLKMNATIMDGDNTKIEESINEIQQIPMNKDQKAEVYLNAFNYYIDNDNKEKVDYYKNLIATISKDEQLLLYVNRLYDVKILKKATYLDEMLKELESGKLTNKATHYLLISEMYKNNNDKTNQKKYNDLYIKEMEKLNSFKK